MNLIELDRALRQLRLGGMAAVIETRLHQAQVEPMTPIAIYTVSHFQRMQIVYEISKVAPNQTAGKRLIGFSR